MKNIRIVLSESFPFLVVKFSVYLNRHVFVMYEQTLKVLIRQSEFAGWAGQSPFAYGTKVLHIVSLLLTIKANPPLWCLSFSRIVRNRASDNVRGSSKDSGSVGDPGSPHGSPNSDALQRGGTYSISGILGISPQGTSPITDHNGNMGTKRKHDETREYILLNFRLCLFDSRFIYICQNLMFNTCMFRANSADNDLMS